MRAVFRVLLREGEGKWEIDWGSSESQETARGCELHVLPDTPIMVTVESLRCRAGRKHSSRESETIGWDRGRGLEKKQVYIHLEKLQLS